MNKHLQYHRNEQEHERHGKVKLISYTGWVQQQQQRQQHDSRRPYSASLPTHPTPQTGERPRPPQTRRRHQHASLAPPVFVRGSSANIIGGPGTSQVHELLNTTVNVLKLATVNVRETTQRETWVDLLLSSHVVLPLTVISCWS